MERKLRVRVGVVIVTVGLMMGFFTAHLFKLQKQAAAQNTVQTAQSYTYYTTVSAARGNILDRNGKVLVSNRASYNLEISSYVLFNSDTPNESLLEIAKLCRQMGLSYPDHLPVSMEKPYVYTLDQLSQSWQGYYRQFLADREWDSDMTAQNLMKQLKKAYKIPNTWTEEEARLVVGLRYELALRSFTNLEQYVLLTDVSPDTLAMFKELGVPALTVQTVTVREYNTPSAAHILGRVGLMDEEEYKTYKEEGYPMNARVGKDGLEKAFEPYLHGIDGQRMTTVSQEGEILGERYAKLPQAGNNVVLSIDLDIQEAAESALQEVILDLRQNGVGRNSEGKDAEGGSLVAIDVKTGEILASASYPTFDLSTYSRDFNKLLEAPYAPLYNRSLQAAYPPGSIYKMATSIAAIDEGAIGRYYEIRDRGIYTYYPDYQPKCLIYTNFGTNHGVINMMEALSVSCNYYFYEIGRLMGIQPMDQIAQSLGLGEKTGVEIPEELGYRANPETKKKLYPDQDQSGWYDADTLMAAIGQSENRFTPMQLASYTAALANQGSRYEATFLKRVVSSDYRDLVLENAPVLASDYKFSDEAMKAVVEGMKLAATSGTASTYLKNYPVPVAAKTGTAQHGGTGSDHGSFVCFAPADDPQIAIAIYVEKGAQGGNLAKAATQVMDVYFADNSTPAIPTENAVG